MHKTWHKNTNLGAKVVFFLQIRKKRIFLFENLMLYLHICVFCCNFARFLVFWLS
jgi:hypothetical protein